MSHTVTLRLPQIDLAALLAQPHPTIDLRVHNYDNSTRNFLQALTSYKNRALTTISDRRKHQASEKKKIMERTHAVEAETKQCKLREVDLVAQLEREKEERKDAELSVAGLKRQLAALVDKVTSVESDIQRCSDITNELRREKNKERTTLSSFASHIPLQSQICEQLLGCSIEGIEKDRLLIRFSHVDTSEPDREANLVIDTSTETYKVLTSSPQLPSMQILVHALNESQEIYTFLRDVRTAFKLLFDTNAS